MLSGKRSLQAPQRFTNLTAVRIFPLRTREVKVFQIASSDTPLATFETIARLVRVVSSISILYQPARQSITRLLNNCRISLACRTSIVLCRIAAWKTINRLLFHRLIYTPSSSSASVSIKMGPTLPTGTS